MRPKLLQDARTGKAGRSAVSSWPEEEVVDLVEDADDEGVVPPVRYFLVLFPTTFLSICKSTGPNGISEMPERSHALQVVEIIMTGSQGTSTSLASPGIALHDTAAYLEGFASPSRLRTTIMGY